MSTKKEVVSDPNSCLNKAADDEPIFVLRGNDPVAAMVVRNWAEWSNGIHEPAKIAEARQVEADMVRWHEAHPKAPKA